MLCAYVSFGGTELELSDEIKDLVNQLLIKDPEQRLGTQCLHSDMAYGGNSSSVDEIKYHPFFERSFEDDGEVEPAIDWDELLEEKACFVPQLDNEMDTSYFDTREDRYNASRLSSDSDSSVGDISSVGSEHSLSIFRNFSCVNLASSINLASQGRGLMHHANNDYPTSISMPSSPFQEQDRPIDFTPASKSERSLQRSLESGTTVSTMSLVQEHDSDVNISDTEHEHVAASTPNRSSRTSSQSTHSETSPPPFSRLSLDVIPAPVRSTPPVPSPLRTPNRTPSLAPGMASTSTSTSSRRSLRRPSPLPLCISGCEVCDIVTLAWDNETGFGISFQTELGNGKSSSDYVHRITQVDERAPAGRAGVHVDSIIIQVNKIDASSLNRRGLSKVIQDARGAPAIFHCRVKPNHANSSSSQRSNPSLLDRLSRALTGGGMKPQGAKAVPPPKKKKKRRKLKTQWDWLSRFTRSPATSPVLEPIRADSAPNSGRNTFNFGDQPSERPSSPSKLRSWQKLLRRKSSTGRSHLKSSMSSLRRNESLNSESSRAESSSSCGNTLSSSPTSKSMHLPSHYAHPPPSHSVSPSTSLGGVSTDGAPVMPKSRPSSWHVSLGTSPNRIIPPRINVTPSTPSPKMRRASIDTRSLDAMLNPGIDVDDRGSRALFRGMQGSSPLPSPELIRTATSSPLWSAEASPCTSPLPPVLYDDEEFVDPAMYPTDHSALDAQAKLTM